MKKTDVKIKEYYKAKVTNKIVTIKILAENPNGGWDAMNLSTGKKIRIKSAQRLRGHAAKPNTLEPVARETPEPTIGSTDKKKPSTTKPVQNTLRLKKASILDAAVRVLSESKDPLNCKSMVETMITKDYWKPSKSAKTPGNTLHAAISKEIKTKGKDSRFKKVGRGQFTLSPK